MLIFREGYRLSPPCVIFSVSCLSLSVSHSDAYRPVIFNFLFAASLIVISLHDYRPT